MDTKNRDRDSEIIEALKKALDNMYTIAENAFYTRGYNSAISDVKDLIRSLERKETNGSK